MLDAPATESCLRVRARRSLRAPNPAPSKIRTMREFQRVSVAGVSFPENAAPVVSEGAPRERPVLNLRSPKPKTEKRIPAFCKELRRTPLSRQQSLLERHACAEELQRSQRVRGGVEPPRAVRIPPRSHGACVKIHMHTRAHRVARPGLRDAYVWRERERAERMDTPPDVIKGGTGARSLALRGEQRRVGVSRGRVEIDLPMHQVPRVSARRGLSSFLKRPSRVSAMARVSRGTLRLASDAFELSRSQHAEVRRAGSRAA